MGAILQIFLRINRPECIHFSEIRYKKVMYFPDRGCVRTLRTLYVYPTAMVGLTNTERCLSTRRETLGFRNNYENVFNLNNNIDSKR